MKTLLQFITESKLIKGTKYPTQLPEDIKKVIVDYFKKINDIKDSSDIFDYFDFAADEVWDYIFDKYGKPNEKIHPETNMLEIIWPYWGKDIIKAVL